ncbi:MAG: (d)CMP kinase [Gemmatimonadaceae bacterium]|nr:(d)CMP kinase [Gemmatimonadaceae bacterium]
MTKRMVIAIDGPAASGKSSTAKRVAKLLGYRHVDSGSLYRAATAAVLRNRKDDSWTESDVVDAAGIVTLKASELGFVPLLDGADADAELRGERVTKSVSRVAQMRAVRDWVDAQVRLAGSEFNVVVDGRDIGTVVFPDAKLKIFLVADPWERARRRLVQQHGGNPTQDQIADETERIVHRDSQDATQTVQARDAILIDTTHLTQDEQVERIVALAHAAERDLG